MKCCANFFGVKGYRIHDMVFMFFGNACVLERVTEMGMEMSTLIDENTCNTTDRLRSKRGNEFEDDPLTF